MAHTYTNTRSSAVRIFTPSGPRMLKGNETATFSEPISGAPYWVVKVEEAAPAQEPVVETTVSTVTTPTQQTTVAKTTKSRRRKTTTTIEKE